MGARRNESVIVVLTLVLATAGISAAQAKKKTKRYPTGITAAYTAPIPGPDEGEGLVAGKLKPQADRAFAKKRCKKNRSIEIRPLGGGVSAAGRTEIGGSYSVAVSLMPGTYEAVAKRKRLGRRAVCRKGASTPFTVG